MELRTNYHQQLKRLQNKLSALGQLSKRSLLLTVTFMHSKNEDLLQEIFFIEEESKEKKDSIDRLAMTLLLKEQPVALELRFVTSSMKIASSMFRITRQSSEIAELLDTPVLLNKKKETDSEKMSELVYQIVHESNESLLNQDENRAYDVIELDDEVDALFEKVKEKLIDEIGQKTINPEAAIDLLMIFKYLERIADHAVKIADLNLFVLTGKRMEQTA